MQGNHTGGLEKENFPISIASPAILKNKTMTEQLCYFKITQTEMFIEVKR